ncbi:hypothetical protein [Fusobacterium sp.]|uniref:hypothetical protein n=1 Tax=Fusobacterium sp. TaxID=68766 RepID=UPI0028FF4190|nr:hypothetical protein [Fusobacterium sp.]MDU1912510.1 hypothetical protein [Fusobacterium sp.]
MAKIGSFTVDIKDIHLDWGIPRDPGRKREEGEGYIQIPMNVAIKLEIYNSGHIGEDQFGINLFHAKFLDGFCENRDIVLKASGNSGKKSKNYEYAKNLHGYKNLKLIKEWFDFIGATKDDKVQISITSFDTMELEII